MAIKAGPEDAQEARRTDGRQSRDSRSPEDLRPWLLAAGFEEADAETLRWFHGNAAAELSRQRHSLRRRIFSSHRPILQTHALGSIPVAPDLQAAVWEHFVCLLAGRPDERFEGSCRRLGAEWCRSRVPLEHFHAVYCEAMQALLECVWEAAGPADATWIRLSRAYLRLASAGLSLSLAACREAADLGTGPEVAAGGSGEIRWILASNPAGFLVVDPDGTVLYTNTAACEMLGVPASELTGRPLSMEKRDGGCVVFKNSAGHVSSSAVALLPVRWEGRDARLVVMADSVPGNRIRNHQRLLLKALDQSPDALVLAGADGRVLYVNAEAEKMLGCSGEAVVGLSVHDFLSDARARRSSSRSLSRGRQWRGRIELTRPDTGEKIPTVANLSPVRDYQGEILGFVGTLRDARRESEEQKQLLQHEKLAAIGQLAAGVAHEINTPTQYVGDNTTFLKNAFDDVLQLVQSYRRMLDHLVSSGKESDLLEELRRLEEAKDLPYLLEEIPRALEQSLEGIARISKIVGSMKEFAHPDQEEKTLLDLNRAVENTVTVARNEWKYIADVTLDLDPDLRPFPCFSGAVNQALLNIIVNAAHAIQDALGDKTGTKGCIRITTRRLEDEAEVRIEDTGTGIPPEIRDRIFEPFFTTKGVGKGTGQGLAVVHQVVVERHGGSIDVETEPGKGTVFILRFPLDPPEDQET